MPNHGGGWGVTRFKAVNTCHPERRHYAKGLCKTCYRNTPYFVDLRRTYYQANKSQWILQNQKVRDERRRQHRLYGISKADFDRMITSQNGLCAICHQPPTKKGLSVDHNHTTGGVRELLCSRCNTAIGLLRDSPDTCRAAAEYLERHHPVRTQTAPENAA